MPGFVPASQEAGGQDSENKGNEKGMEGNVKLQEMDWAGSTVHFKNTLQAYSPNFLQCCIIVQIGKDQPPAQTVLVGI